MPRSTHVVQAYDVQPIPGSAQGAGPPSLLISVAGQVTHGGVSHPSPGTQPKQPYETLPRTFSQNFILVPIPQPPNPALPYLILTDAYRFV
ncbi:hypothetical protein RQP46_003898 [Phenoliferia psychrophenolica]